MPAKRVLFTCSCLLLLGLLGVWEMLAHLGTRGIEFNVAALFLPAAILLSLGISGARWVTNLAFAANYLTLLAMIVGTSWVSQTARSTLFSSAGLFSSPEPVIQVLAMIFGAVLMLLHWMMYSPPFDSFLAGDRRAKTPSASDPTHGRLEKDPHLSN